MAPLPSCPLASAQVLLVQPSAQTGNWAAEASASLGKIPPGSSELSCFLGEADSDPHPMLVRGTAGAQYP